MVTLRGKARVVSPARLTETTPLQPQCILGNGQLNPQSVSNFGLPLMIVTDNGSSFVSEEFQTFLAANGIIHRRSSPYHPATNGLAEHAVQTFKHSMRKLSGPLDSRLSQFLFRYRITPHTSTKISLAEAMFGRPLRSRLDVVYPDTGRRVQTQPPRFQSEVQDISAR